MILSASRRTDIPGYYSEWFVNRLKQGYVLTRNPMNQTQVSKILLSPDLIDCIVFWTKDPINMMDKLGEIDALGFNYYFQFTITPYGRDIERNLRDKNEIVKTFRQLSEIIGKDRVLWRYDPILLNDEITVQYHIDMFAKLCRELQGYTNICTISFADVYSKISKRVKEQVLGEITETQMHDIASTLAGIGRNHGIELRACSEIIDLSIEGIRLASCIDKETVERVCGHTILANKDKNQRPECGCIQSVDIGVYNTCKNGCVYCYANHSDASIDNNCSKHDSRSNILIGTVSENEKIINRVK